MTHTLPDRLYDEAHWFAVYTSANREKIVAAHLTARGIEHFLPLYETVHSWSDRYVKLQRPLFPSYLFVYFNLKDRRSIVTIPGVSNLVNIAGRPASLAPEVIHALRDGIRSISTQPYPYLCVGQRVAICSGPLKGLTGILLRRKHGPRVVISVDAIERSFLADVAACDLVPLGRLVGLASTCSGVSSPQHP